LESSSTTLIIENLKDQFLKKNKKKNLSFKHKLVICWIIGFISISKISNSFSSLKKTFKNKPFLPFNKDEIIVKEFNKTKYDSSKLRYHYEDLYKNRTLFIINYDYHPYEKIKMAKPFYFNANIIFKTTGMLNMTLLYYYYFNNITDRSNFNHIHVCMGIDKNFVLLSLISISSLFNNSGHDTFIHLHILLVNCELEDIKKIHSLRFINKNVEFIFYNAKQVEYDFPRGKKEVRGLGDYTRVLAPEIVNNTNRIIILDSGDIFVNKDLSELYFFDIGDNYFVFSLENIAGGMDYYFIFGRNNFYPNSGVCLVNVRKFREDNLYYNAFYASIAYSYLPCPYQDIFLVISNFKFKFWPLNYNCPQFFENDKQLKERKNDTEWIKSFMEKQKNSPFKYTLDEIFDAADDPIISHLYSTKPILNLANKYFMNRFWEYANMSGFLNEIKSKYPNISRDH